MPPQVGRMHASHLSNPFAHLNPQHSIPQSTYQSQASQLPGSFNAQHGFGSGSINGISPFATSGAYGTSAFTPGAGSTGFSNGVLSGQGQGLASVAAQQGFARGAAMQEHSAHQLEAATMDAKAGATGRIRQVWKQNLEQEMAVLRQLIIKYPYVSMVCFNRPCSRDYDFMQPEPPFHRRWDGLRAKQVSKVAICFTSYFCICTKSRHSQSC